MAEIRNLEYETGVKETFTLEAGGAELIIQQPDGWESINCVLNINTEFFNVDDFILGESQRFKILEYYDKPAFDFVKAIYDADGGDGKILFKWSVEKDAEVFDILGSGYQLNLNKYQIQYEKSGRSIELEIKKRESNNKLLTREDVSVDIFSETDLDDGLITPAETVEFYYKEKTRSQNNFYFFKAGQLTSTVLRPKAFFVYTRASDYEIGDNVNEDAGYDPFSQFIGDFLFTRSEIRNLSAEFSNFEIICTKPFKLIARIKNGGTVVNDIVLVATSSPYVVNSQNVQRIAIVNETFELGVLNENQSLEFLMLTLDGTDAIFENVNEQTSIELKTEIVTPLRRARMVTLATAIDQIAKLYTNNQISLQSEILQNGYFSNSAISTGMFLRGISDFYYSNKLKTSLKAILYDSAAPLMALGYDVMDNTLKVESVDYFFKNVMNADFSAKEYIETETTIAHDTDFSFNELVFGSKKHSTGTKGDLRNFNTKLEALTPIESAKRKLDKTTEFIIDDFKIQNLILDTSQTSRSTDDDLVLLDLIEVGNFIDDGVLSDCVHMSENGYLTLICYDTPFDTIPLTVGQTLTITSGLNAGSWPIMSIDGVKLVLNRTTGIEEGTAETPIEYVVTNILKNRNREGFFNISDEFKTASNIRHNPKYHLARWYGYYGGGLLKKPETKTVKITDYTNNGTVIIERGSDLKLANEISGRIRMDEEESLERLNNYKSPYFAGETIETTLMGVTFTEFIQFYTAWRIGDNSRGYVKIDTPIGVRDVFIFGEGALDYDRARMELKIKGKIRNENNIAEPGTGGGGNVPDPEPTPTEFTYTETFRSENEVCGRSDLEFELNGSEAVTVVYSLINMPEGGNAQIKNADTNELIATLNSDGESYTQNITLNGKVRISIMVENSSYDQSNVYGCVDFGNGSAFFYTELAIEITGTTTVFSSITAAGDKYTKSGMVIEPN